MVADYVSVFNAIIIGLAVADLAMSFHKLMRHRERVRWDWLILAVVLLVLLNLVSVWWVTLLWYGGAKDMSIAAYLPDLAILLILFLASAAILPDDIPAEGLDLRAFYLSNASYFWTLWVILVVLVIVVLGPRYLPNTDWQTFVREEIPNFAFLLGAIILARTSRYWVHVAIVMIMLGYTVWNYLPHGLV
jgi:hypothetical protein